MNDQKNLLLAVVISMAIFFGFDYFFPKELPQATSEVTVSETKVQSNDNFVDAQPQKQAPTILARKDALAGSRVKISTDTIQGSLNLKGARFDDVTLNHYNETPDEAEKVSLLSPGNCHQAYYADMNYVSADENTKSILPTENSIWQLTSDNRVLRVGKPIQVSYVHNALRIQRTIEIDDKYMISVRDSVMNTGSAEITLAARGNVARFDKPEKSEFFILHQGPIGYLNGKLQELSYENILEQSEGFKGQEGWFGFTDKYWLVSLVPDQKSKVMANVSAVNGGFKTSLDYAMNTLKPGQSFETQMKVFAGPKVLDMLDVYEETIGMHHFDLAVDFGWFYFLTKPLFRILTYLNDLLGNFGIAILVLTVLFKLLMFPLANKSFYSMARMRKLGPKIEKLKEKHANDSLKMNQELMALYKKEKVNPASGCLPMLIQMPIFFCLYKVLFVTIEMRHAPFFGWINDLSAPDPTTIFNLFGLIPWDPPSVMMLGAWPLIMGATMFLQQKMSPPAGDPAQAKMMLMLPIIFTFIMAGFPAGLLIYWAWSNVLSIAQQWYITKRAEANMQ